MFLPLKSNKIIVFIIRAINKIFLCIINAFVNINLIPIHVVITLIKYIFIYKIIIKQYYFTLYNTCYFILILMNYEQKL